MRVSGLNGLADTSHDKGKWLRLTHGIVKVRKSNEQDPKCSQRKRKIDCMCKTENQNSMRHFSNTKPGSNTETWKSVGNSPTPTTRFWTKIMINLECYTQPIYQSSNHQNGIFHASFLRKLQQDALHQKWGTKPRKRKTQGRSNTAETKEISRKKRD